MKNPFLNALPVIASALGDSLGVEVVMNAGQPRTNGKQIFLPSLDADKPESRMLGIGFITHESAHIRFTDFALPRNTPLERMICNLLEDIRIEKLISRMYPGCKLFLAEMVEGLVKTGYFAPLSGDENPTVTMQQYMLHQLRLNILEQEGIAGLAQQADEQLTDKVPAGMRVRLNALMYQVEDCQNTSDVLDLSRAIITMMEEEAKKEEEKQSQQQGEADPNQQQSQTPQDDQDESQQQDGQNDKGGAQQNEAEPDSGSGSSQEDPSGQDAADIIKQILSAGDDDALKDTGEVLKEALGQTESHVPSSAAPFKNHVFDHRRVMASNEDIDSQKNLVNGASNALRVRAQALLQAQTLASKRNAFAGTKLNVKNLHQARLGGPVFQKVKAGVAVDTAIAILVDRSGSMSSQIGLAMNAALATTLAFDRPDVKTAVFSFPYSGGGEEGNAVLKRWDGQAAASIPAYMSLGVEGSTPMAEAMMGAGISLMQRPEKRKILLVATDGEPDNVGQAHWVINLARKSGIEVLGLGIQCDVTKVFGPQWAGQISDIDCLPEAMIGMLDNIMLKKAA